MAGGPMVSAPTVALAVQLLCGMGVAAAYFLVREDVFFHASNLVDNPTRTLRLFSVVQAPIVIGAYSTVRSDAGHCSYWWAVGRGLVALPLGALLNAFGAIVLGAPFWFEFLERTTNWSLLMSLFTFVPAACVFGSSRKDWQRILALSQVSGTLDQMISLPAYGAIIGAWIGAFPMPLDWERPWQEWPICVTYGAIAGYMFGIFASLACIRGKKAHAKAN